ncbi:hypothetical protein N1Z32_004037 [Klebsiella pneumoniae]|uniref:Uncharacterized protein n=1 Tax=Klebsiella michiganensis TaxID=1134687 RepID=A0AB35WBV1_9ENTR|nr:MULTISPECIES: hypothetical protein [Klebsiella]APM29939.1 hypothetical protein AGH21_04500 [Klebsiella oxytoca]HBX3806207.1 hypothetical protein [Klebsiella pneumoniae subsp. pneumoniae]APM34748.1 hypothetical protein AGH21_30980 [Klebsiella oxytoca]EKU0086700.1 hypothetical protein [Klebsiella pneumoniae]EKU6233547.1 hypothetical protein [Klebsiella pneumoniae]
MSIKLIFSTRNLDEPTLQSQFESEMKTRVQLFYPDHDVSVSFHDGDDLYEIIPVENESTESTFRAVIAGFKSDIMFYSLGIA